MEEERAYQKGFNDGYLLQQHEPDIANLLSDVKSETAYLQALRAGREQYLLEVKERLQTRSKSPSTPSKDKGISRER